MEHNLPRSPAALVEREVLGHFGSGMGWAVVSQGSQRRAEQRDASSYKAISARGRQVTQTGVVCHFHRYHKSERERNGTRVSGSRRPTHGSLPDL